MDFSYTKHEAYLSAITDDDAEAVAWLQKVEERYQELQLKYAILVNKKNTEQCTAIQNWSNMIKEQDMNPKNEKLMTDQGILWNKHVVQIDRNQVLERSYKQTALYDIKYFAVPTCLN